MNPFVQGILDFFGAIGDGLNTSIGPVARLVGTTPLEYTTANEIVSTGWKVMAAVADSFLALFAVVGILQILYGQHTGQATMPPGQFFFRMLLSVIMIHLSFMLGQDLIIVNNQLCGIIAVNVQDFVQMINGGKFFTGVQSAVLSVFLSIVFGLSLLRVIFQAVKRIIFFNVLFMLSGPAFLMTFLPQTSAWFAYWARTYVVTTFTQFFQYLTFGLGIQFFLATKQNGLIGFVIAIAMLHLVAEIPALLSRFATNAGASAQGVGDLVRTGMTAAMLFMK